MTSSADPIPDVASFVLPHFHSGRNANGLFSFRKESLNVLGLFKAGEYPVVFDPINLKNETPIATLLHEQCHQHLMINTSFGYFHQCLEYFSKQSDTVLRACRMSLEEQWSVQEFDATYLELLAVAVHYPRELEKSIAQLPSEILDEPPYREVYDSVARYLPIDPSRGMDMLTAQQILMHGVSSWSMSNDCLVRFSDPQNLTVDSFQLYLERESPRIRFARLMTTLLTTRTLWNLLERVALAGSEGTDPTSWLLLEFSSLMGEPAVTDIEELKRQADVLEDSWLHGSKPRRKISQADNEPTEPLSVMMAHPSVHASQLMRFRDHATLTIDSLRAQFATLQTTDLGVYFALSTDGSKAHVQIGTYFRGEGMLPLVGRTDDPAKRLTPDYWGALPFEEVCRVLDDSRPLPHILIFRGIDTWDLWNAQPGGGKHPDARIWICTERLELSLERVQHLLTFRSIGHQPRLRILGFPNDPTCWAFFEDSSIPNTYAMIEIVRDPGLYIFDRILQFLAIEPVAVSRNSDPDALWTMLMIIEEQSAPPSAP